MKENKGKGLVNEEVIQEEENVQTQALSSNIDLVSLPSRRGNKKPKHGLSKYVVIKTGPHIPSTVKQSCIVQILDVEQPKRLEVTPSKPPSDPPDSGPKTLLRCEGLA